MFPARRELDATGRLVTPGFIDIHTHYDPQVLWDGDLTPSSLQGVTGVVAGNCGYSLAPTRPEDRASLLRTLDKVEDMRLATLEAGIVWDFETYAEYLAAVERRGVLINFGGYVGHTAVRLFVMGDDAYERPATEDEIDRMKGRRGRVDPGRGVGVLHRSGRVPPGGRRSSGTVDGRHAGGDRGADPCDGRDRAGHGPCGGGRELCLALRARPRPPDQPLLHSDLSA